MNIVFCASEAAPFIKTGGLGDVAYALPAALAAAGNRVTVVLPLYGRIKRSEYFGRMKFIRWFMTELSWRRQYTGIYTLTAAKGLTFVFIDNEYYFDRPGGIYGEYDDGERFAFFSKAAIDAVASLGLSPDVIHCNDWQTAALPVFLREFYPGFDGTRTLFTIHNIEYQGIMPQSFAGDVMGLSDAAARDLEFSGCTNLMKGAIVRSDAVSTVSRTYAEEILDPFFSHGLDPVLRENSKKLRGIVNGIDTRLYDPATDPSIAANFSAGDQSGKAVCKRELQRELGLEVDENIPLCGIVSRLASHKGFDLVARVLYELADGGVQFAILGTGEERFENFFRRAAADRPGMISANIAFSNALASKIYAGSDIFLMPSLSEPCGLSQLVAMRYGAVPVVRRTGGLKDTVPPYDPSTGEGRGFTFETCNAHDMKDAVLRAAGLFRSDRDAFLRLRSRDMSLDLSWGASVKEYSELYKSITG